jgi:hypothetical protein
VLEFGAVVACRLGKTRHCYFSQPYTQERERAALIYEPRGNGGGIYIIKKNGSGGEVQVTRCPDHLSKIYN